MNFNVGDRVIWSVPSKNLCGEYGNFVYSSFVIDKYGGQELCGVVEDQMGDNNWGHYPDGQYIILSKLRSITVLVSLFCRNSFAMKTTSASTRSS